MNANGWSVLAVAMVGWLITVGGWFFASRAAQEHQRESLRLQLRDKHFNDLLAEIITYADSLSACWREYDLLPLIAEHRGLEAVKSFIVDEIQPARESHKQKTAWLTQPKGYLRMMPVDPSIAVSAISSRDFELDDMFTQLTTARYDNPELLMDDSLHKRIGLFRDAAWELQGIARELARTLDSDYYRVVAPYPRQTIRQRAKRGVKKMFSLRPRKEVAPSEPERTPTLITKNGFYFLNKRLAPLPVSWAEDAQ